MDHSLCASEYCYCEALFFCQASWLLHIYIISKALHLEQFQVRVSILFFMPLQCGINLRCYLVNFPISKEIVLNYYSLSLNMMPARNCCHFRVHSNELRSEKCFLSQRGDWLFFWFEEAAHHILFVYRDLMDALFFIWESRLEQRFQTVEIYFMCLRRVNSFFRYS